MASTLDQAPARASWRVVDIVVASVLAVACGVLFWVWSLANPALSAGVSIFAPLSGLLTGGWLVAAVLGGLVIRKPGAAVFCELVAALVEMVLGSSYGFGALQWGLAQGIAAELVFAAVRYRRFSLPVALLAGAAAGLACGLMDTTFGSAVVWEAGFRALYVGCSIVSGAVIAGLGGWAATRALASTGALTSFAAGRSAREV